jgi:uncharacterized protein (DUF362 family)
VRNQFWLAKGRVHSGTLVLAESGLEKELQSRRIRLVNLNRDEIRQVPLQTAFTGLDSLWVLRTVLISDVVVSMPKVKTHHWAGVTLSMKNMFGVVPGIAYGWPKNLLHCRGIDRSILDVNATVPAHFVIADGIIGMDRNGPLHGSRRLSREVSRRTPKWRSLGSAAAGAFALQRSTLQFLTILGAPDRNGGRLCTVRYCDAI